MARSPPPIPYVPTRSETAVRSHWQYRDFHGRILGPEDDTFLIPPDALECDRLDLQHRMLELVLNSHYAAPEIVERVLAPVPEGPAPAVLDVGSGNGTWAVAMARKFEHCEVVGIDLTPTPPNAIPVNCSFITDDANYPMEHHTAAFNVVHCRGIDGGITDYGNFLNECARALRPGGILLLVKGFHRIESTDFQPLDTLEEGEPGFTAIQKLFGEAYEVVKKRGGYEDAALYWKYWLTNNPNYVKTSFVEKDLCVPVSAWQEGLSGRGQYMCELMKRNLLTIFRSFKALLVEEGYPAELIDRWVDLAEIELEEKRVHAFARWRFAYAIRTNQPWMPGPFPPP